MLIVLFVAVVVAVVAITKGQRRIPTQSAKHVRGRRVYGGTRQFLPLRVNQAGVMPVIFASSLLMLPMFLFKWLSQHATDWRLGQLLHDVVRAAGLPLQRLLHRPDLLLLLLLDGHHLQPEGHGQQPEGLRQLHPRLSSRQAHGRYLERVMMRITYVGAAFLAVVAIIPSLITTTLDVDLPVASFYGGTGLLIVISVALDLVQKINSHLVMRNYPGLTED